MKCRQLASWNRVLGAQIRGRARMGHAAPPWFGRLSLGASLALTTLLVPGLLSVLPASLELELELHIQYNPHVVRVAVRLSQPREFLFKGDNCVSWHLLSPPLFFSFLFFLFHSSFLLSSSSFRYLHCHAALILGSKACIESYQKWQQPRNRLRTPLMSFGRLQSQLLT